MAMNKTDAINAFHNMLSMQVKNLHKDMEVDEYRPDGVTSIFKFSPKDTDSVYAIQTVIQVKPKSYVIDVTVVEENVAEDGSIKPELIDTKAVSAIELGMKDSGVKLAHRYIRGMVKAIVNA